MGLHATILRWILEEENLGIKDEDAQQIFTSYSARVAQPLPFSLSTLAYSQETYEIISTASQKPTKLFYWCMRAVRLAEHCICSILT
jgi:hypothetical protein